MAQYKDRSPDDYDQQLLDDIWKKDSNGVASVSPGFLSGDEYESLLDELPSITSKTVRNPSLSTIKEVYDWAKGAREKGQFKTIKWSVIHRVFAAANPTEYST